MSREDFMRRAIEAAVRSAHSGAGGPFGCVVVRNGEVIAEGTNEVTARNDPTAHAEVVAIRRACEALGSFQLDDCEVYTSCEPCPMCLGAIYWSRPARVFFGATRTQAAVAGFDDEMIYREMVVPLAERVIPMQPLLSEEAERAFAAWRENEARVEY